MTYAKTRRSRAEGAAHGRWRRYATAAAWALATAVAVGALAGLGFWQLERAEVKRELWRQFGRGAEQPVHGVASATALAKLPRFARVRVSGRFDAGRTVLHDNRVHSGRNGVAVYTPLRLSGGGAVLVNRGWQPLPPDREVPRVETPGQPVTLAGRVDRPPRAGLRLGEARALGQEWPQIVTYLDIERVAAATGYALAPRIVRLSPGEPHGYVRDWQPTTLPPSRHVGYAVQWFALAAALMAIYLVVNLRGRRRADRDGQEGGQ